MSSFPLLLIHSSQKIYCLFLRVIDYDLLGSKFMMMMMTMSKPLCLHPPRHYSDFCTVVIHWHGTSMSIVTKITFIYNNRLTTSGYVEIMIAGTGGMSQKLRSGQ